MNMNRNNLTSLEEFKEKHYGKLGTPERDELEAGSNMNLHEKTNNDRT
jgi:hypothetical protein